mgnify:CR=1 FL=1
MILSPSKNDKFDKAESFNDKAKVIFGKDVGEPIGLAYDKYSNKNVKKHFSKDFILYKFSQFRFSTIKYNGSTAFQSQVNRVCSTNIVSKIDTGIAGFNQLKCF